MTDNKIKSLYFGWLLERVCDDYQADEYSSILNDLYSTPFTWIMPRDEDRALDGLELRSDFCDDWGGISERDVDSVLGISCNVLEMLVALAIRIETEIMYEPDFGDRTGHWFWTMIDNCGLGKIDNSTYSREDSERIIKNLLSRNYLRDGSDGCIFVIRNSKNDLRKTEIWYQMNYYLTSKDFEEREKHN